MEAAPTQTKFLGFWKTPNSGYVRNDGFACPQGWSVSRNWFIIQLVSPALRAAESSDAQALQQQSFRKF